MRSDFEQAHLQAALGVVNWLWLLRKQLMQWDLHEWCEIEHAEDGVQIVRQFQPILQDPDLRVDTDGDPDLGLDRVLGGAEESLDPKMPFSW